MGLCIHKLHFPSINNSEYEVQRSHLPLKQRRTRNVHNMKVIWPLVLPRKLKLFSFWHWEQRLWCMLQRVRRSLHVLVCKLIKCDYAREQPAGEQPEASVSSFLGQKTHRASESKALLPGVPIKPPVTSEGRERWVTWLQPLPCSSSVVRQQIARLYS